WVFGDMTRPEEATNTALIRAGKLFNYVEGGISIYHCPGDRGVTIDNNKVQSVRSYSLNAFMGGRKPGSPSIPASATDFPFFARESEITRPSSLWVFVDEDERSINDGCFVTDPNGRVWFDFPPISPVRHNFSTSLAFADGHADVWKYKDIRTKRVAANQTEQSGNIDLRKLAQGATIPNK